MKKDKQAKKIRSMLKEKGINFEPTDIEFAHSSGLSSFDKFYSVFEMIKKEKKDIKSILDCGCGYGTMAKVLGEYFNADKVHGIDSDDERLKVAKKSINAIKLDLERDSLPFPDNTMDFILCSGTMAHMTWIDNLFDEIRRILKDDGYFLFTMPNLGSWTNLMSLSLGYQISDVQLLKKRVKLGLMPTFRLSDHIHTLTLRAAKDLLKHYDFQIIKIVPYKPVQSNPKLKLVYSLINFIDFITPFYMQRRFLYVCKKKKKL